MKARQINFGIGVGLLALVMGWVITGISQAGWNLVIVGVALSLFALTAKFKGQEQHAVILATSE